MGESPIIYDILVLFRKSRSANFSCHFGRILHRKKLLAFKLAIYLKSITWLIECSTELLEGEKFLIALSVTAEHLRIVHDQWPLSLSCYHSSELLHVLLTTMVNKPLSSLETLHRQKYKCRLVGIPRRLDSKWKSMQLLTLSRLIL